MLDKDELIVGAFWDVRGFLMCAFAGCPTGPTEQELFKLRSDDELSVRNII